MKIISYNVNGVRAAIKKGFLEWLSISDADIVCLQEIKAQENQLDLDLFVKAGYSYTYWFSAQKKGYSGVAVLCKYKPNKVVYGVGIPYMDNEGRHLRVDFDEVSVMSMYLPSGTNVDRIAFKLQFMDDFRAYIKQLTQDSISNLVVCGDYNVCHQAIDIHDPVRNKKVSGFLPEERQWMTDFIADGFIDTYRLFHPNQAHQYTWWSYRANARNNNKGWRLDYMMATDSLKALLKGASILQDVKHSDHCPVTLELAL